MQNALLLVFGHLLLRLLFLCFLFFNFFFSSFNGLFSDFFSSLTFDSAVGNFASNLLKS